MKQKIAAHNDVRDPDQNFPNNRPGKLIDVVFITSPPCFSPPASPRKSDSAAGATVIQPTARDRHNWTMVSLMTPWSVRIPSSIRLYQSVHNTLVQLLAPHFGLNLNSRKRGRSVSGGRAADGLAEENGKGGHVGHQKSRNGGSRISCGATHGQGNHGR
jgi:hypothetical protein